MGLILSKIAVVFSMAGIGLGANKLGVLPTESNKYLISLLLNIATPCLLITSIAGKELTGDTVRVTVVTMTGAVLFFLLAMIVVGVQLGQSNLRKVVVKRKLLAASLFKLIAVPAMTLLVVYWLPIPSMCKLVLTFSACFPSAVNMVAVASLENRNATLASEGVALTTILSMVSLPAWIILLSTLFSMQ